MDTLELQVCVFGKYTEISPTPERFTSMMQTFPGFLPVASQAINIDAISGKVENLMRIQMNSIRLCGMFSLMQRTKRKQSVNFMFRESIVILLLPEISSSLSKIITITQVRNSLYQAASNQIPTSLVDRGKHLN